MTPLYNMNWHQHIRKNWKLAFPLILANLGHMMVGVADSIMVGKLGAAPLAASALAHGIFVIFFVFGSGVSMGSTPLIAKADAEGNKTRVRSILKNSLWVNIAFGIIISLVIFFARPFISYLNQPAEVVELAIPYLQILILGILPIMVFQVFKQGLEGLSMTKPPMIAAIAGNILNIILNYFFIFGKAGFPEMGLNGAGWASLIARIFIAGWIIIYVIKETRLKDYIKDFWTEQFSKIICKDHLKLGVPTGFQITFEVGGFVVAMIMVGTIGTNELAAHQIAINMAAVTYMISLGFSQGATVRAGNQLGLKDFRTLKEVGTSNFVLVGSIMTITAIAFIVFKNWLPTLYIDDEVVVSITAQLLVIAGLFQLSDGIQVVGLGLLRGMQDVKFPTWLVFVAYWVLGLPIGYLLAFELNLGIEGIWYGLLIGLSVVAVIMMLRFYRKVGVNIHKSISPE